MNANILKAAAIALPMVLGTAIADDTQQTQDALSGIAPMTETDLAVVTGARYRGSYKCYYCENYAKVTQINASLFSKHVYQDNFSYIHQSNN